MEGSHCPQHLTYCADRDRGGQTCGQRKICQTTRNGAAALGDLIGICQMDLAVMRDARRTQSELPTTNYSFGDGDGKKQIRFANIIVIEKIRHVRSEVIGVQGPATVRDGNSELMFFVALAMQRDES